MRVRPAGPDDPQWVVVGLVAGPAYVEVRSDDTTGFVPIDRVRKVDFATSKAPSCKRNRS